MSRLFQDDRLHIGELREPLIECDDLEAGCLRERRQIGVIPDVWRILRPIGKRAEYGVHVCWFERKLNSRMRQKPVVNSPSLILGQSRLRKDRGIVRQPQETQLSVATKMAHAAVLRIGKPRARRIVMPVSREGQRNPKVDIRKEHSANPLNFHSLDLANPGTISGPFRSLPRLGLLEFARLSGEALPECLRERLADHPALFRFEERGRPAPEEFPFPRKQTPAFPPGAMGRQGRRLHSECGRLTSCCHFTPCISRPQGRRTRG